jgi:SAM-dependent methyltransferase
VQLTAKERATVELFGDLHRYAKDDVGLTYTLPILRAHLAALGLNPDEALRGKSFLDGGCGGYASGAVAAAALGARPILGVDLSEDNVQSARRRLASAPEARFERQNLLHLDLPSDAFDFVYSNGVLMITEDPERAFRELVRVLKPGGRIYIGVYGRGGLYNEVAVPLGKLLGRIVPRRLTETALQPFPILLRPSSSLLDLMYCPIERHYRIPEVAAWFQAAGFTPTFLRHVYQPPTLKNRLLFGDGTMIFFSGVKPA